VVLCNHISNFVSVPRSWPILKNLGLIESTNTFYRAGIPKRLQLLLQFLSSPEPLARSISESLGKVIKKLAYCYIMFQERLKHIGLCFR
jgi:hypothetical protein